MNCRNLHCLTLDKNNQGNSGDHKVYALAEFVYRSQVAIKSAVQAFSLPQKLVKANMSEVF
jgi:hypothetical protein